jgi:hypothetical protein
MSGGDQCLVVDREPGEREEDVDNTGANEQERPRSLQTPVAIEINDLGQCFPQDSKQPKPLPERRD